MALRKINFVINVDKEFNGEDVPFYRGDDVEFSFSFANDNGTLDISAAKKIRVSIRSYKNGQPDMSASATVIAGEADIAAETYAVSFTNGETAVPADDYYFSVVLLDASSNTVCSAAFPFRILESGYSGIWTPTPDFRDEVLDARDDAIAAKTAAEAAQAAAETAKSDAQAARAQAYQAAGEALDSQLAAESAAQNAQNDAATAQVAATQAEQSAEIAVLHADEPDNRRKADLSRWQWVDLDGAVAYIPSLKSLSAPLTICLSYDLAKPLGTGTANFSIFSGANYYNDSGAKYFGISMSITQMTGIGITALSLRAGDGGTAGATSSGLSVAYWNAGNLPAGKHTLTIVLHDSWAGGVTGRLKAQAFVDGKLFKNNSGGDYGEFWGTDVSRFDFSYREDKQARPAAWNVNGYYYSKTPSSTPLKLSRGLLLNVALPATQADDLGADAPLGYSVEQYDAGEDPPQSLLADDCYVYHGDKLQCAQWRDAGSARAHAVIERGAVKVDTPALNTDTLTWSGTVDAKAILSATTNTVPANTRVALRLKASAACTVAIGDGAASSPTTYVSAQTLEANKWTDVPAIYTTADGKLTVKPSAALTGTINAQLTLEPLN